MRVLVQDTLIEQVNNRIIPPDVLPRLFTTYQVLAEKEKEGYNSLVEYITKGDNGKTMKGVTGFRVFKFRLTEGDRILYTYGKYLPYLQHEKDSLVLLGYSKHDNQGFFAKHTDFAKSSHEYGYLANIVKDLNDISLDDEYLSEEDKYEIASLIISNCFKGYAYTDEELCQFSPEEIDKHLLLSEEQKSVINRYKSNPSPTLIMGGAGTGKTLIAVHMLNDVVANKSEISVAYFTQSKALLEKVKNQYEQLQDTSSSEKIVDFWDINRFCLELTGKKEKELIKTNHFIEDFMGNVLAAENPEIINALKKHGISYYNVWTEIRGTIKGGMQNWTRVVPMNQDDVTFNISKYEKSGYIKRLPENKKQFELCVPVNLTLEKMSRDDSLDSLDKKNISEIISHFTTFDVSLKSISDEHYLSLNDEFSVLSKEQRILVLKVYHLYDKYLFDNNLMDENDLIRLVLKAGYHKSNTYDFIFVDEIQDYTELQIYLLYLLADSKNSIVYAGDIHQIINPTLFNIGKLKELFMDDNKSVQLREEYLTTNFRCQKGVVDVANNLSELRRKTIGSNSLESEQEEKSNVSICLYDPYRLKYSKDNIISMMMEIIKYPQVAILVPDNSTKSYLQDIIKDFKRPDFIFTADEIKGMEYDYVICFDLINYYNYYWRTILSSDIKNYRTKYRYYFNLLYVAITRARRLLCFIDESEISELESVLKLKTEESFDADLLHFTDMDASLTGWLNQAREYKKQGLYSNALQFYNIAKEQADISEIYDCYIGIAEEKRDYSNALKYAIIEYAFTRNENQFSKMDYYLKQLIRKKDLKTIVDFLEGKSNSSSQISSILEKEFQGFSDEEKNKVSELFLDCIELQMIELIGKNHIPILK